MILIHLSDDLFILSCGFIEPTVDIVNIVKISKYVFDWQCIYKGWLVAKAIIIESADSLAH